MKCYVCATTWADAKGGLCPRCGYDAAAPGANDLARVSEARETFKEKTTAYSKDKHVTRWDFFKPWMGVALGIAFFLIWLRACTSLGGSMLGGMGERFW